MSPKKPIRGFLKTQQTAKPAVPTSPFKAPSLPAIRSSDVPPPTPSAAPTLSCAPKPPQQRSYTSSLSPPPRSNDLERPSSQHLPLPSSLGNSLTERVIQNSDDEGDSDSSLEDLSTLLAARSSSGASRPRTSGDSLNTSRYQTRTKTLKSPVVVSPKYKFDLKDLVAHKKNHEAAEASSKRFKALQEPDRDGDATQNGDSGSPLWSDHSVLLDAVVADREDGAVSKIKRALRRTEATVSDPRWYFFDAETSPPDKPERQPFPVASVPECWESVLVEPQMRQQAFLFGFVEDMVAMGQGLPDELYLWMLDEVPVESSDPLRTAYLNIFRQCHEQTSRLLTPLAVQKILRSLGGTVTATILTERVRTVQRLTDPYPNRDWKKLHSIIKFFGQIAELLDSGSRTYIISLLLRLSLDCTVSSEGGIHDSAQQAIGLMCLCIPDEDWDSFCYEICKTLSESTHEPPLRLQAVESISSATPRAHDLRRRLATAFFLDDLSYSKSHSHTTFAIDTFLDRLMDPLFDTTPTTNYRDLTSLIYLLDVAVDDGQNVSLDLTNEKTAERHNKNVDELIDTLAAIESGIVATGGIFVSRLDARMALLMVQKRLAMLRTKPKPRHHWFDGSEKKKAEQDEEKRKKDLSSQKEAMARFLKPKKKTEIEEGASSAGSETDCQGIAAS
ncbi:hypothetical protein JHW43_003795 [Diplocarpon mali]|nr:hypothetical protein JHW43_003795 [Diplocarpon mali]